MVYDTVGLYTFWVDLVSRALFRSDANGSNMLALLCPVGCNKGSAGAPTDLQFDRIGKSGPKLYWIDRSVGTVMRANRDGSAREVLGCRTGCTNAHSDWLAFDSLQLHAPSSTEEPWLYWLAFGAFLRMRGDGTEFEVLMCQVGCGPREVGFSHLGITRGLQLDISGSTAYAYWADFLNREIVRVNTKNIVAGQALEYQVIAGNYTFSDNMAASGVQRVSATTSYLHFAIANFQTGTSIYRIQLAPTLTAPEPVLCSQLVGGCTHQAPSLTAVSRFTYRKVGSTYQLWFFNRLQFGELELIRTNLDGSGATVVVSGAALIPEDTHNVLGSTFEKRQVYDILQGKFHVAEVDENNYEAEDPEVLHNHNGVEAE
jgi:hypothetical protein